ncbi:hypothetical protein LTR86_007212 [Recurvomyces mirabilis]|nr:hypothetical protein LTR86_007212 [Recurvomyces mirabilis]
MASYSTGSSWGFPDDIPGGWSQDDIDAQLHDERPPKNEPKTEPGIKTEPAPDEDGHTQPQQQQQQKRKHYPSRTCRICLDTILPTFHNNEDGPAASLLPEAMRPAPRVTYESPLGDGGRLIRPCKCKGSQKYVHEECLGAWRRQDPLQKRNFWQCPTCRYKYHLQRLTWGRWLSSTTSQIGLTLLIFVTAMFLLGFVADPIINLYLDPVETITTAGGPTGSLIYDDEPASWIEHFIKGLASLGLLGFAKFLLTLSPWHWFNMRNTGLGLGGRNSGMGNNGRDRLQGLSWIAIVIGVVTVMFAVWKGVRLWSRRMLERAGERVMDVPGVRGEDEEDDDD